MKKILTLLFSTTILGASAQCVATGFATPGACSPSTNTYDLSGSFYFVGEPTTGSFVVTNSCGGSQTFSAPFTSPITFNILGLTANGANCTVTGGFTAVPTCFYSAMYTAPTACAAPPCTMTATATPGACNPTTNTYTLTGSVTFVGAPTTGTLTVVNACGGSQTFYPPFAPVPFSIPGITANGAPCAVTCSFSDLPSCSYIVSYMSPAACGAPPCVMTATATPGTCNPTTNTYTLTGNIAFVGPPTTGTLTVVNACGGSQTFFPPFVSTAYSIPGITANGAACAVTCSFSALPSCSYLVSYMSPAACGATSIEENHFLSNLIIAPNPSNGFFNLSFEQQQIQSISIDIVDVLGRNVYSLELEKFVGSFSKKLDLTSFNKGIYFVRITGEKSSEIHKIIYY